MGSYLLGSALVGELVCRVKGVDIRSLGTGNPGAANIWRQVGARYGAAVFLLDIGKGVLVTLPLWFMDMPTWFTTVAMVGMLAGQFFPVFFGFDGNTGMAAMFGATAGLLPLGVLIATPVAIGKFRITKNVGWAGGVFFATAWLAGGLLHGNWWAVGAAILGGVLVFGKQIVQYKLQKGDSTEDTPSSTTPPTAGEIAGSG